MSPSPHLDAPSTSVSAEASNVIHHPRFARARSAADTPTAPQHRARGSRYRMDGGNYGPQQTCAGVAREAHMVAMAISYAAVAAKGAGVEARGMVAHDVDDWCDEGWPRRFPRPAALTHLVGNARRDAQVAGFAAAALAFAELAVRLDGCLCGDLSAAAERLAAAALFSSASGVGDHPPTPNATL